jgi:Fur family ferric uptake transcriptional regulator
MTTATIDPTDLLRQAGLRVTAPRVAILTELARLPHVDVDTLSQAARELRVLPTHEIGRRFEPAGQPARYEINTGDNHHHIVCRTCGTFGDVDCAAGQRPCLDVVDAHGFLIDEAEVLYWGLCPTCQAAAKAP